MHDHPWAFVSIILWGGYWESVGERWIETWGGEHRFVEVKRRWMRPGSFLFRRAEHAHRIELEPGRSTWTLVLTWKRCREWGFFTRFGWLPWRKYDHAKHCAE